MTKRWMAETNGALTLMSLIMLGGVYADQAQASEGGSTPKVSEPSALEGSASEVFRPEGKVVSLSRGVELVARDGAKFEAKFSTLLPVGPRGAKVVVQTVEVDEGRVDAFLPPGAAVPRGLLLQAPDKVLGISTGGHMAVSVSKDEVLIVAVDGEVLVGQDSKFKLLAPNTMRRFPRNGGPVEDIPLPSAPRLASLAGLGVAWSGSATIPVSIESESNVRLALLDEKGALVGSVRPSAAGKTDIEVPHAGLYKLVARSVNSFGFEGGVSKPITLRVLGLAQGQAGPTRGVFLLRQGERVMLAGTEGLEMRYGTSPTYVPAAPSVGLPQGRATTVELRDPQSPSSVASLRLEPHVRKKVIELSPTKAVWPGEPVKVHVGIWDGAGRAIEPGPELSLRVTVNGGPVDVQWKNTDDGLFASVPQQSGAGPWVVRVQAFDGRGRTIVRDFLEVAAR